jgi:hypothetical protein
MGKHVNNNFGAELRMYVIHATSSHTAETYMGMWKKEKNLHMYMCTTLLFMMRMKLVTRGGGGRMVLFTILRSHQT